MRAFLDSVNETRLEYGRIARKIERLETDCTHITERLTGYTGKGGTPDAERLWAALADERSRLGEKLKAALDHEHEVEDFIAQLSEPNERIILRLRYLDCLRWPQVFDVLQEEHLFYSERHVFRLHGEALNSARRLWERIHREDEDV